MSMIFSKSPRKIVGTLVVRDEEDILEHMLRHTLSSGVDALFVTDNNSKDRTPGILAKFPEIVDVFQSDDMTHNQEKHTTYMARVACKLDPSWIVHLDADEFWCGLGDFEDIPEEAGWSTTAYIHPPTPSGKDGTCDLATQSGYIDFKGYAKEFKIIHRPDPHVIVRHGNHGTNKAPVGLFETIHRHHYPIRSFSQFRRKTSQGNASLNARGFVCERWHRWNKDLNANALRSTYNDLCRLDASAEEMREILIKSYKVMPRIADDIFRGLESSGQSFSVESWIPPSYIPRKIGRPGI